MYRIQIVLFEQSNAHRSQSPGVPRSRLSTIKSLLATGLALAAMLGFFLAVLFLGAFIAAVLLILVALVLVTAAISAIVFHLSHAQPSSIREPDPQVPESPSRAKR